MSYQYENRKAKRKLALDYLGGKCVVCGATENLQFDHIDPSTKSFTISARPDCILETLLDELDKCQLLCAQHHKEKSSRESFARVTHGKYWAAYHWKCQCELCLSFKKKNRADRREKRTGSRSEKRRLPRTHGTYAMYKHGCRCDECKAANTAYMTDWKSKNKRTGGRKVRHQPLKLD